MIGLLIGYSVLLLIALDGAAGETLAVHSARVERPVPTRCACTQEGTQRPTIACPHCRGEGWVR